VVYGIAKTSLIRTIARAMLPYVEHLPLPIRP
jgi:hypothetical protein